MGVRVWDGWAGREERVSVSARIAAGRVCKVADFGRGINGAGAHAPHSSEEVALALASEAGEAAPPSRALRRTARRLYFSLLSFRVSIWPS